MTDKTEAMDNLIAQDADLIEICSDDLVRRLRSTVCQGNLGCHRLVDDDEAADRIEALEADIERLREALEYMEYSEPSVVEAIRMRVARAAFGEKQ